MSFIWTQSACKDLEKPETCPSRWKAQWIDKLFKPQMGIAADYGNYFEYLCIGANAKGEALKDLPRNKDGSETAVHRRIRQQAAVFAELFDPLSKQYLGYTITSVQGKLSGSISGVEVEGTYDILDEASKIPTILDLKMTEDITNTRTVYGWGNPSHELDLIQQVLYQELYFQMYGVRPNMVLLVFEHGTQMRVKIIKLNISEERRRQCFERFEAASSVIEEYERVGWSYDPSEKECGGCGISSKCPKRFIQNQIFIENINY